jgi:uncharacterized cupin superfamily protein
VTKEAELEQRPNGLRPATDGWFVVNVGDAAWATNQRFGASCRFESSDARFPELGVQMKVIDPGQPSTLYHAESLQEACLVLAGECRLLVEEQERLLKAWDFVHLPPRTRHSFVGAGDGPCILFLVGARSPAQAVEYAVSTLALGYGAGVEKEMTSPADAYAPFPAMRPERPAYWERLPWSR